MPVGKLTKAGKLLKLEEAATKGVKDIVLKDGYYFADGVKISEKYYNDLWTKGRPAPFIQAREILNSNPKVMTDPRAKPGFLRYVANGLELVYNPTTKEIWHIQPEKK